ncbi:TetR/AcrR family transcriptional regulator [Pseudomonas putida]|uniref:TetR/AcrR family transcriptional regulator n=1 Tax=Pseudomonas putida TaxID=303 RepID=A0AAP9MYB1_PSEPU|nr:MULTISPECIES: TetR/AcrR family transcriptional regulator [Pseudomonas]MDH1692578.1 TetR/AcrR family transcriptional regulator [Pseudomonas sp. GD03766]QJQ09768.1 TetR/AcrR family transcriptional regulator [Pseudomonas putida]
MPPLKQKAARDRLLEAAATLFYNDGITATGIDTITAKAGVAKMSLYNNFSSKADLVAAFIEARHAEWLALYDARIQNAQTPRDRILAVFDAYADHANCAYERGFRGCGLLNAAAELPVGDVGRTAVKRHKEHVEQLMQLHLAEMGITDTQTIDDIASHLSFLLEGSMSRAGLEGNDARVQQARRIAASILEGV